MSSGPAQGNDALFRSTNGSRRTRDGKISRFLPRPKIYTAFGKRRLRFRLSRETDFCCISRSLARVALVVGRAAVRLPERVVVWPSGFAACALERDLYVARHAHTLIASFFTRNSPRTRKLHRPRSRRARGCGSRGDQGLCVCRNMEYVDFSTS